MPFYITFRLSQMKVLTSFLTNIGAGLFLLPFTTQNILVLTVSILLAILCLSLSIKIEDLLEEL